MMKSHVYSRRLYTGRILPCYQASRTYNDSNVNFEHTRHLDPHASQRTHQLDKKETYRRRMALFALASRHVFGGARQVHFSKRSLHSSFSKIIQTPQRVRISKSCVCTNVSPIVLPPFFQPPNGGSGRTRTTDLTLIRGAL